MFDTGEHGPEVYAWERIGISEQDYMEIARRLAAAGVYGIDVAIIVANLPSPPSVYNISE